MPLSIWEALPTPSHKPPSWQEPDRPQGRREKAQDYLTPLPSFRGCEAGGGDRGRPRAGTGGLGS